MSTRVVPLKITAGDTLKFAYTGSSYSSTDGYGLTLKLTGPSGSPQKFSYNANTGNTATTFDFRVAPEATANLAAGIYSYALVADDGTDSFTVESGTVTVELRADLSANSDLRSHNQKVLEAIEALIEGRASNDVASYTIAGRSLAKIPLKELIDLRKYYKDLVREEQGQSRKKLYVRFPYSA